MRPQKHDYEWRVNVTQLADADGGAADGTDAESLSAGELEGRRQIVQYLAFLRAKVPGFEQAMFWTSRRNSASAKPGASSASTC